MVPGLKILSSAQSKQCDLFTLQQESITGTDLMERASARLYQHITNYFGKNAVYHIVCGPGNNGGDGLCIAALMAERKIKVRCSVFAGEKSPSPEMQFRLNLPNTFKNTAISICNTAAELQFQPHEIIIDSLFGTGIHSPLQGLWADIIQRISQSGCAIASIDVPSGLLTETPQNNAPFVQANHTFTIQHPKPAFFYPENRIAFSVVDAGIRSDSVVSSDFYLDSGQPAVRVAIQQWLPHRPHFGHKGTFGHTLLIGGNEGMSGAIALSAKSCFNAGSGLTTVWAPPSAQIYLGQQPSVMHKTAGLHLPIPPEIDLHRFNSIAIGPGLGNNPQTSALLNELLSTLHQPLILDADALNILASDKDWLNRIPKGSLLTPHPKEFERLFGRTENGAQKLELLRQKCTELGIFILAKDNYSALCSPNGSIIFNGTGDHKMARGGSGDKLTGTIAGLFAQNQDMLKAATCAMFYCGEGGLVI